MRSGQRCHLQYDRHATDCTGQIRLICLCQQDRQLCLYAIRLPEQQLHDLGLVFLLQHGEQLIKQLQQFFEQFIVIKQLFVEQFIIRQQLIIFKQLFGWHD